MQGRQVTVSLCGKDLIVDTEAVGRYLARDRNDPRATEHWKNQIWKGQGLDILWFDELDHAQVFDSRQHRENLIEVIRGYSLKNAPNLIDF